MLTAPPKTPGVYINEIDAFPNSVVEVATAVPAFIGYTQSASSGGKSLLNVPTRITSLTEFTNYFGGAPTTQLAIAEGNSTEHDFMLGNSFYRLSYSTKQYSLYNNMRLFFQNGGGACYIVSVGLYGATISANDLQGGLDKLVKEQEPTMIVIPEAVLLAKADCIGLQQQMLLHCQKMQSRFAILDVFNGFLERTPSADPVAAFRNDIGMNALNYGAAYYPWLNTSIVQPTEVDFTWIASGGNGESSSSSSSSSSTSSSTSSSSSGGGGAAVSLTTLLLADVSNIYTGTKLTEAIQQVNYINTLTASQGSSSSSSLSSSSGSSDSSGSSSSSGSPSTPVPTKQVLDQTLLVISPAYKTIMDAVRAKVNLLSPGAAMAGVYTLVDNTRGVWKAPANVSLSSVISPTVNISHDDQEDLNVPLQGKAVNAIRPFVGEGIMVWGARTLDGNSQDWRYVNVRRTMIMLEQSIKIAAKAYVFEPNDANTWVSVKSMINNFLTGQWKAGALVGAKPEDAFDVQVGLGATMTADDILNGIMNITVKVAISHPAEFIVITFQQQQQKS